MNETTRREIARLREYNASPPSVCTTPKRRRGDVRVVLDDDTLRHQVVALREEVRSLRALLQRLFRTGLHGVQ